MDNKHQLYLNQVTTYVPTHCDQIALVTGLNVIDVLMKSDELMETANWSFKSSEISKDRYHRNHEEVIFESKSFEGRLAVKVFVHPVDSKVTTIKFVRNGADSREELLK